MSTRHLIQPEIKRMLTESWQRQSKAFPAKDRKREEGFREALYNVEKLLLGIGVKVQSTTYPEQEETLVIRDSEIGGGNNYE